MRIQTERLLIMQFETNMALDVHLNSLDEDVRKFLPDEVFETVDEARAAIAFLMSRYESDEGPFVYPVLLKNGTNIGYVQLIRINEGWEIGYHIAKGYTGRGFASEATLAFLHWAKRERKIEEVFGICAAENIASRKVMQKCGFELYFEGDSEYQGRRRYVCKYRRRVE